jgi:hypothetical protein
MFQRRRKAAPRSRQGGTDLIADFSASSLLNSACGLGLTSWMAPARKKRRPSPLAMSSARAFFDFLSQWRLRPKPGSAAN